MATAEPVGADNTPNDSSATLSANVQLLGGLVGDVLREQAGEHLFQLVEEIRTKARSQRNEDAPPAAVGADPLLTWAEAQSNADLAEIVRAFSVYFHMINAAEQHQRIRVMRKRERDHDPAHEHEHPLLHESIASAVAAVRASGGSAGAIQAIVRQIAVHPVLTAHPSEARRRSLLLHLERVADLLARYDDPLVTPRQRALLRDMLYAQITLIWQTAETRRDQPSVIEEVQSVLAIMAGTIYDVAPAVQRTLEQSIAATFPTVAPPGLSDAPFLRVGSWVGGDRDGNPRVNAEISRATARMQRAAVLRRYHDDVQALGIDLSVSQRITGVAPPLLASIDTTRNALGQQPVPQWADEPYRRACGLVAERLRRSLNDEPGGYVNPAELAESLQRIADSLKEHGGARVATGALRDLQRRVQIFGFHLAELEIRQHSARHTAAITEILQLGGLGSYLDLDEAARQRILAAQLTQPPLALSKSALSPATRDVLDTLHAMSDIQQLSGPRACQTYIISMTHAPSDVLAVLVLAREAGLFAFTNGAVTCALDVVPLFEESRELRDCDHITQALLSIPIYRATVAARGNHQQIMIGYSDSNKDAGYVAATWQTFHAQSLLAHVAASAGVALTIFHGRGGGIGRGGGPMGRALLARPDGARFAELKVTEQGEVVFARYSHPAIAERHFEQIVHGLLLSTLGPPEPEPQSEWRDAIERLSDVSKETYESLVKYTPDFLTFYREATPFPELGSLNIASRPVSRSGGQLLRLDDLRAIPWGFSWNQIRANLPGWYGLGTALDAEIAAGGLERLQMMYGHWRFFTTLLDNAQRSLGAADMATVRRYLTLTDAGDAVFARIQAEYDRSVGALLQVVHQTNLLQHAHVLSDSIRLRNPYVDALHVAQIVLLRRYRALPTDAPTAERAALLDAIHHSINGIAAGLQTTG